MNTLVRPARDRVPTEVWEAIFNIVSTAPKDPKDGKGYSFILDFSSRRSVGQELPTMVLAQVCTRWRAVARGSPRLWCTMSIELSALLADARGPLSMYLTHSKNRPLEVSITFHRHLLSEHGHSAWGVIQNHLPRCKNFTLETRDRLIDLPIPEGLSFPILESFSGSTTGLNGGSSTALSRAFQRAPKLARLCLMADSLKFTVLPYSQLTSLSIPSLPGNDLGLLLTCLSACDQLQSLTINEIRDFSGFDFEDEDPEPDEQVPEELIMPCLRILQILEGNGGGRNIHIANELLETLVMPALLEFEFTGKQWPGTGDSESLYVMSQRSPLLERVALRVEQSDETEDRISSVFPLLSFLYNLPQLQSFSFTMLKAEPTNEVAYSLLINTALSQLFVELSQPHYSNSSGMVFHLLPRLESIHLDLTDIVVADPLIVNTMLDVVALRASTSTLKEFTFAQTTRAVGLFGILTKRLDEELQFVPALQERIKAFGKAGMNVTFRDRRLPASIFC
ncbi:hypothetical protein PM082_007877 [Marasmius tenuissimus]|nr:hypothetical protein PM082_007877 [Marasmius tenuissimus]